VSDLPIDAVVVIVVVVLMTIGSWRLAVWRHRKGASPFFWDGK
jgi:hypothetical protein